MVGALTYVPSVVNNTPVGTAAIQKDWTKRSRRDVLADYRAVLAAVYSPAAYFGRVRRVGRMLRRGKRRFNTPPPHALRDLCSLVRLVWRLPGAGPGTARQFWKTMLDCAIHNPRALRLLVMLSALDLHHGPFSRQVIAQGSADRGYRPWSLERASAGVSRRKGAFRRLGRRAMWRYQRALA